MSAEAITRPAPAQQPFYLCLACLQPLTDERQVCGGRCYDALVGACAERQQQREMEL